MPSLSFRAANLLFFPLEMLVATLLFAKQIRKRKGWWIWLIVGVIVITGACFLLPWLKNLILNGVDDENFSYYSFAVTCLLSAAVDLVIILLYIGVEAAVFDTGGPSLTYLTCATFLIQNMARSLYYTYLIFRNPDEQGVLSSLSDPLNAVMYFVIYVSVYCASYFLFVRKYRVAEDGDLIKRLSVPVIFIIAVNLLFGGINAPRQNDWATAVYLFLTISRFCLCAIGLIMQFFILSWYKMKFAQSMSQHLMELQREQYNLAKESIDIVNVNAHDLKKQINIILKAVHESGQTADLESGLTGMIDYISVLDTSYRTGNKALDVTLTEKSRICLKKKIKLSTIADGNGLGFMSDIDIYSLFGNALDNAIEAVERIDVEEDRIISFSVRKGNGVISVHVENTYEEPPRFIGGVPQTIKSDKRVHGFGVKSMINIAKKYGGNLTMNAEAGIFTLDVILPLNDRLPV